MRPIRSPLSALFVPLALLALGGAAHAESFRVQAQIFCPAFKEDVPGRGSVVDPNYQASSRIMVPCRGVQVQVMDQDNDWDDFCGQAFTDSQGRVNIKSDCSDIASTPDIYLKIIGRSKSKVRVGVQGWNFWDYLAVGLELLTGIFADPEGQAVDYLISNDPIAWTFDESNTRNADDGDILNFNKVKIGEDNDDEHLSARAGMAFFAGRFSMNEVSRSGFRPTKAIITVDHPSFGAPTTIWNTIIIKDTQDITSFGSSSFRAAANALPHEMGHATYNRFHSDFDHFFSDALGYLHSHNSCSDFGARFGWYEGYAQWVLNYAYSASRDSIASSMGRTGINNFSKSMGCFWSKVPAGTPDSMAASAAASARGYQIEGNVTALLNQVFLGNYRAPNTQGNAASDFRFANVLGEHALVAAKLNSDSSGLAVAPALSSMFRFVQDAGEDRHTAKDFFSDIVNPFCSQLGGPATPPGGSSQMFRRYCNTVTFQTERDLMGNL